jgi:hypothetical protein
MTYSLARLIDALLCQGDRDESEPERKVVAHIEQRLFFQFDEKPDTVTSHFRPKAVFRTYRQRADISIPKGRRFKRRTTKPVATVHRFRAYYSGFE